MSRLIRRMGRIVLVALNLTASPLSGLVPRSPKRWVFGHTRGLFGDNPKYLFLWMTLHRPDIQVTWITGSAETRRLLAAHGYRVHRRWSLRGILAVLRAGVFVFSHHVGNVNGQLSRGALLTNLWHGVGLKAVHFGHPSGRAVRARRQAEESLFGRLRTLEYLTPPDIFVTTSDFTQAHFARQFELPPERCPQLGYPRLDCAVDESLAQAAVVIDRAAGFEINAESFAEVYIYMPTYRDTSRSFLAEALPDLDRLSAILAGRHALLYIKPHLHTDLASVGAFANIRLWPRGIDHNTYLADLTGLITDYSSALYDYLAVRDTGAILYTFDFDTYVAEDRALLYSFDDNVAGLRVATFVELCDALRDGTALNPALGANVERIRDRFWGGGSSPASPAIVDYVEEKLNAPIAQNFARAAGNVSKELTG